MESQSTLTVSSPVRPNLILGICCLSLLIVSMDATIVNVGLPSIRRELHASIAQLQWIVDVYTMVVASLLMFAGSTADRFGRRRVFQLGMLLFTFGSFLCSIASGIDALIASRVVQALGATMLNPVAMSIITNTFTEPKERARAIGIWGAVAGISMALGPITGGALTQLAGWRSMFWINLPIGLAAVVLAALYVPESKATHARRADPIGQLLVFVTLASLIYAVIEGQHAGWFSAPIVALFIVSGCSLAALLNYESRRHEPLLDLRFFRSIPFSSAAIIAVCGFAAFSGFLFLNTIYFQEVRGLSALQTGLCTLPFAFAMMILSPISGRLVGNYGTRMPLLIAGAATMGSALILSQLAVDTPMLLLMLAYVLFGSGLGMVNAPITNTAVSGMPRAQAGLAAAVASTSRQVGASLGVAIAGTITRANLAAGQKFSEATHDAWWLMIGCGVVILILGLVSNSAWAKQSAQTASHLLDDSSVKN